MTDQVAAIDEVVEQYEDGTPFADDRGGRGEVALRDPRDAGTIDVLPPARTPTSEARQMLRDNVAMLDDAYRVADIVCQTPAAPRQYRGKAKEATVAIMYGAELGLPPMASLQKVINIHGSPSLEARTMKGLLKAKGFQFRTVVKTDDEFIIHAWEPTSDKRTDPPDEIAHWTIARAVKARYVPIPSSDDSLRRPDVDGDWVTVSKTFDGRTKVSVVGNMKYITDPTAMLEAKGTAEVCRSIAPEVLMGLPYASEERDDWQLDDPADDGGARMPADVPPARPAARARGVNRLEERAAAASELPSNDFRANGEPREESGMEGGSHGRYEEETPPPPAAPPTEKSGGERRVSDEDLFEQGAADPVEPQDSAASAPDTEPAPPTLDASSAAPSSGGPVGGATEHPRAADDAPTDDEPPLEMSPAVRQKGEQMLAALLDEANAGSNEDAAAVVSEIAAKRDGATYRAVGDPRNLSNRELKYVVDVLRAWKGKGKLGDNVGEALNASSLREAGLME